MLLTDTEWTIDFPRYQEYTSIHDHIMSNQILDYTVSTKYYNCVRSFKYLFDIYIDSTEYQNLGNLIKIHCNFYTNCDMIKEILYELIYEKYHIINP